MAPAETPVRSGRALNAMRPVTLERGAVPYAEGSCLVAFGNTRVLCAASVEDGVPGWRKGSGLGWITAEYSMLPRATQQRTPRENRRGGASGRTHEIQRLIGRSLRTAADMRLLGERTITLDCDVLQADGGTRTAAITGAYVAFAIAAKSLLKSGKLQRNIITNEVAAISVGIVGSVALLDLKYDEDSKAEVDMNVVCTGDGRFIELQGTAEREPFSREQMESLLGLAAKGIQSLIAVQRETIAMATSVS